MMISEFPVLDADRPVADAEHNRTIVAVFDPVEPYLEEIDSWCAMPLRLTHDRLDGWQLELGPYTLDLTDIRQLSHAINAYYRVARR